MGKRRTKVYKVVKVGRTLRSAVVHEAVCGRDYAVGEVTTGFKGTPLLAFRTLFAAREWRDRMGYHSAHEVYSAHATDPKGIKYLAPVHTKLLMLHLLEIWDGWRRDPRKHVETATMAAPVDAVACDTIELIEKVT